MLANRTSECYANANFCSKTYILGVSHKYQQLPLIPVEEFLQQHPEHADDDETSLMTARINHEHAEREALEQARQGLLKKKQVLIADNKKRKDDLANLDQDLEKFIDACVLRGTWYGGWLTGYRPPNRSKRHLRKNTRRLNDDGRVVWTNELGPIKGITSRIFSPKSEMFVRFLQGSCTSTERKPEASLLQPGRYRRHAWS